VRTLLLGASVGALVSGLQAAQARLAPLREEMRAKAEEETNVTDSVDNAGSASSENHSRG
jgi:hypothetical protein